MAKLPFATSVPPAVLAALSVHRTASLVHGGSPPDAWHQKTANYRWPVTNEIVPFVLSVYIYVCSSAVCSRLLHIVFLSVGGPRAAVAWQIDVASAPSNWVHSYEFVDLTTQSLSVRVHIARQYVVHRRKKLGYDTVHVEFLAYFCCMRGAYDRVLRQEVRAPACMSFATPIELKTANQILHKPLLPSLQHLVLYVFPFR